MKSPTNVLVSIIIPCYNAASTLERCLSSVVNQDYENLEIIVVDDKSSDGSKEMIQRWGDKDPRIAHASHPVNRGVSSARNTGLRLFSGKYVMFVDADDRINSDYVSTMVRSIQDADLACSAFTLQKQGLVPQYRSHGMSASKLLIGRSINEYLDNYFLRPYVYTMFVHCWGKLFHGSVIENHSIFFDEKISQLEDVNFVARYLRHVKCVSFSEVAGYTQIHSTNGENLSSLSGLQGLNPLEDFLMALAPLRCLNDRSSVKTQGIYENNYSHFLVSMFVLFCLRMARRFWYAPSRSVFWSIHRWVGAEKMRNHVRWYKNIQGESVLIRFSLKNLPPILTTVALLLVARHR